VSHAICSSRADLLDRRLVPEQRAEQPPHA
jgi:hypothetical protein